MSDKQKDLIREVFLRNGFKIKDGRDDLADYVYEAAHELLQAVRGEPVAVVDADDEGMWAEILPNVTVKVGQILYTAPQPAKEQ